MAEIGRPPYFDPKGISSNRLYRDIGRSADRPFMIFASLLETSLGDMLCKMAFLSTLKEQFDHARLIVRYRALRSYSADVVSLSPNIDHAMPLAGERPEMARRVCFRTCGPGCRSAAGRSAGPPCGKHSMTSW